VRKVLTPDRLAAVLVVGVAVYAVRGGSMVPAPEASAPALALSPAPVAPNAKAALTVPAPVVVPAPAPALAPIIEHVIIISEDGLRPDVLSEKHTPRHMQLLREGTRANEARTIPESDTLPSHAAMLSGFGAADHGLSWNSYKKDRGFSQVPTIFSVATAHGLSTAMIVGKPKLRHIAIPNTVGHFERPSYLCGGVAKRAAAYFTASKPELMFVHFSDPDEYGHSHGWMSESYLTAVGNSDRCLSTLLDAIDRSDAAATTLVIVTADHGGHARHHSGSPHALDLEIPWIIRGPGIVEGGLIPGTVNTVDTAATVLAALGLPRSPNMRGSARVAQARPRKVIVR